MRQQQQQQQPPPPTKLSFSDAQKMVNDSKALIIQQDERENEVVRPGTINFLKICEGKYAEVCHFGLGDHNTPFWWDSDKKTIVNNQQVFFIQCMENLLHVLTLSKMKKNIDKIIFTSMLLPKEKAFFEEQIQKFGYALNESDDCCTTEENIIHLYYVDESQKCDEHNKKKDNNNYGNRLSFVNILYYTTMCFFITVIAKMTVVVWTM